MWSVALEIRQEGSSEMGHHVRLASSSFQNSVGNRSPDESGSCFLVCVPVCLAKDLAELENCCAGVSLNWQRPAIVKESAKDRVCQCSRQALQDTQPNQDLHAE